MTPISRLPDEDFDTWIDTPDEEEDVRRIERGEPFRVLAETWNYDRTERLIFDLEFVE